MFFWVDLGGVAVTKSNMVGWDRSGGTSWAMPRCLPEKSHHVTNRYKKVYLGERGTSEGLNKGWRETDRNRDRENNWKEKLFRSRTSFLCYF